MAAESKDSSSLRPSDILSSVKKKRAILERIFSSGKLTLENVRKIESATGMLEDTFNKGEEVLSGLSGESYVK